VDRGQRANGVSGTCASFQMETDFRTALPFLCHLHLAPVLQNPLDYLLRHNSDLTFRTILNSSREILALAAPEYVAFDL